MTREIVLSNGMVAWVDDADFEVVNSRKWHFHPAGYAFTNIRLGNGRGSTLMMHRFVMQAPRGIHVDHASGVGLDNQRANLRFATAHQNHQNMRHHRDAKSPYKGIFQQANGGKWVGQIWVDGRWKRLGSYVTPEDAAAAYDEAARKYFGIYARCNFAAGKSELASGFNTDEL